MQNQYYGAGQTMQQPSRFAGAQACKWLLILNIAIFVIDIAGVGMDSPGRLKPWGAFVQERFFSGEIWRVLTCQFLHFGGFHLLGNMLGIFFFGPFVERFWGTKKFIAYYLFCGVAGPLLYALIFPNEPNMMAGASAGIFGIVVALIIIAPNMRVMLLFPPIPMSMRTLGIAYLVIAVYTVLTRGNNYGGEAAHLGGAVMGFILMKFPRLLGFLDRGKRKGPKRQQPRVRQEPKIKPRTHVNLQGDEVDRILDKISAEGFQSLTDEEKQTLSDAAKKDDE